MLCNPYNSWDSLLPDCSRNVSEMSARFACTVRHKNTFLHPTSLLREHCWIINGIESTRMETDSVPLNSCSDLEEGVNDKDEPHEEDGSFG